MDAKRKQLIREYKETSQPMGVYQIRNTVNGKCLIGTGRNLPGVFNRESFVLRSGSHRNRLLQDDWNQHGETAFVFEVLEELTPLDAPDYNPSEDLAFLEQEWLEKIQPFGERGYNKQKTAAD